MTDFFDLILRTNTLNFIVLVGIIAFLIIKLKIKDNLQTLVNDVKSYVESSENEKNEAEKDLSVINDKIKRLPSLIERIKKISDNNVNNIQDKIKTETENKKRDIQNNADRIFSLETGKFKSKLVYLLSEKSIDIAKVNAQKQLDNNRILHDKYIANAIAEIDRIEL